MTCAAGSTNSIGRSSSWSANARRPAARSRAPSAPPAATRDYSREREVLLAAREAGRQYGVSPQLAENILRLLIRSSLTTQEQASVAAQGAGSGRRALVIGGAGKMGRWFVRSSRRRASPSRSRIRPARRRVRAPPRLARLAARSRPHRDRDAARRTDKILRELAMRRPKGVIFDVGSLKSPLRAGLNALKSRGCRVTSLHPMFGPDTELLSGRHVIFVDAGRARRRRRRASCSSRRWRSWW